MGGCQLCFGMSCHHSVAHGNVCHHEVGSGQVVASQACGRLCGPSLHLSGEGCSVLQTTPKSKWCLFLGQGCSGSALLAVRLGETPGTLNVSGER